MLTKIYEKLVNWTSDKDHQVKLFDPSSPEQQAEDWWSVRRHVLGAWERGDPYEMLYYGNSRSRPKFPGYKARLIVSRTKDGLYWIKKCTFTTQPVGPISVKDYAFLRTYTIPQV